MHSPDRIRCHQKSILYHLLPSPTIFYHFVPSTISHSPFPTVADSIQSELEEYKQSEGEVTRLKTAMVSKTLSLQEDLGLLIPYPVHDYVFHCLFQPLFIDCVPVSISILIPVLSFSTLHASSFPHFLFLHPLRACPRKTTLMLLKGV